MKTLYQYIVALLIATMSACTPVPAFADTAGKHEITIYGKPAQVVVSNASKALTKKVLTSLKQAMNTELADAQSARYLVDEDNLMFEVLNAEGERQITLHYGFQVNAKNKLGSFVGFQRICVFTTKSGTVSSVGFVGDDLFNVCMSYMEAVADSISKGI